MPIKWQSNREARQARRATRRAERQLNRQTKLTMRGERQAQRQGFLAQLGGQAIEAFKPQPASGQMLPDGSVSDGQGGTVQQAGMSPMTIGLILVAAYMIMKKK